MTPFVSGIMGLSVYMLIQAGIILAIQQDTSKELQDKYCFAYSIGFLGGLFADNAVAKLREIAYTILGPSITQEENNKGKKENKGKINNAK